MKRTGHSFVIRLFILSVIIVSVLAFLFPSKQTETLSYTSFDVESDIEYLEVHLDSLKSKISDYCDRKGKKYVISEQGGKMSILINWPGVGEEDFYNRNQELLKKSIVVFNNNELRAELAIKNGYVMVPTDILYAIMKQ